MPWLAKRDGLRNPIPSGFLRSIRALIDTHLGAGLLKLPEASAYIRLSSSAEQIANGPADEVCDSRQGVRVAIVPRFFAAAITC